MIRLTSAVSALAATLMTCGLVFGATDGSTDSYEGLHVILQRTVGMNRKVRVEVEGKEYFYIHETSNLFPCREPEPVTIERVRRHADRTVVLFASDRLGSGQIEFSDDGNDVALRQLFWAAFATDTEAGKGTIVANVKSHTFHLVSCNHLPEEPDRVILDSPQAAKTAGYRECPLCFRDFPRVRDVLLERQLGLQAAAQSRSMYPVIVSEAKQNHLDSVGQRVLSRWPSPLKGYDYSFTLVESDQPNAFATPGGRIFVTSALYGQSEADAELEAVLAHEIAHVEKRHGYRQYRSAKRAAAFLGATAVLGGIFGARSGSPAVLSDATQIALLFGSLASALILAGYEQEYEEEADAYAAMYFDTAKDTAGKLALVQVLKKLKYSDELLGKMDDSPGMFASHPGIDERIDAVSTALVGGFPESAVFQGWSEEGKLVATLQLEMQRAFRNTTASPQAPVGIGGSPAPSSSTTGSSSLSDKYSILATLYTTAELGRVSEVKKITVASAIDRITLRNAEKTEVHPLETVGMLFETTTLGRKLLGDVTEIDLDLPRVMTWSRVVASTETVTGTAGERP
ncbi:MAG TPA: M48 family metallopeptidase [Candidatus Polarisedimenticolia bacterium]|nr:M48 family metallopeptidase [Candidatus Polarisedimenticolia bacterium]